MSTASSSREPDAPLLKAEELDAMRRALRSLSRRQREVLLLLGGGAKAAEIARALHVSKNTVGFHLTSAMRKLGLRDRHELIVRAVLLRRYTEDAERPHSREET